MLKRSLSLFAAVAAAACGHDAADRREPVRVHAATTIVQRANVASTRAVPGIVRSAAISPLAANVVGNVVRVHVSEGDFVKAGQLLVEIDARDGRAQTAAAVSSVAAAEANAVLAETTYQRYAALRERHSVSQQELDNAEAQAKAARAGVERAKASAAQARAFLDHSFVRAPMDGVVTARFVDPGAQAAPGIALVTIEDPRALRVEANVPEELQMHPGDRVFVEWSADARSAPPGAAALHRSDGRVAHVQPLVDAASRTSLVKIDVNVPLRSGAFVRVLIPTGEHAALAVPAASIVRRGALTSVFVVGTDGIARMRLITLGENEEVLSGLDAGERIVIEPANVTDGANVS